MFRVGSKSVSNTLLRSATNSYRRAHRHLAPLSTTQTHLSPTRSFTIARTAKPAAMNTLNIATLPRMEREELSELVLAAATQPNTTFAIVDVRDSDHIGGHITTSIWSPSATLDVKLPELIRQLSDKTKVIFHCALSQQRGPSAALRYARHRAATLSEEECKKQTVYVLNGGFVRWQELYGKDPRLTQAYVEDIWRNF